MPRDLLLSGDNDLERAVRAESHGYDRVWIPELWGESGPVLAATIAARTETLGIGTAILNVFSRSPAVLAMTAASLARHSDDRFTLGLGTSTRGAVEGLHGESFDRPVRRAHETIEVIQRLTRGDDRVSYEGELVEVSDVPALDRAVPIFAAALGRANRRMVGRLCDGWIPHNIPFDTLDEAFETVAASAREAGRAPDDLTVAPYVPSAVSEDVSRARQVIRQHVAYYVGSGKGYRRAVGQAFPEAADRVATHWQAGEREPAADAVTDEMVDALGIAGTPAQANAKLDRLVAETVIDRPIVVIPAKAGELADPTIDALAPE